MKNIFNETRDPVNVPEYPISCLLYDVDLTLVSTAHTGLSNCSQCSTIL